MDTVLFIVVIALPLAAIVSFLLETVWVKRSEAERSKAERDSMERIDKALKATDDPNEPARWVR